MHDLCNVVAELTSQHKFSVNRNGRQIKCSRAIDKTKAKKRAEKQQTGLAKRSPKSHQAFWNCTQWMAKCDKAPNQIDKTKFTNKSDFLMNARLSPICADHGEHRDFT